MKCARCRSAMYAKRRIGLITRKQDVGRIRVTIGVISIRRHCELAFRCTTSHAIWPSLWLKSFILNEKKHGRKNTDG